MKKFYFLLLSFLALSLCANAEVLSIDFESATTAYTDWTFKNMTSQQTGSIKVHGGTYYGTTDGKASASITTKNAIKAPKSITFYVSKQSNNTKSSSWKLQVSNDNETWTDVKTQSATSMSKGTWVEVTQNLSSYSNVYVRIYYTGSTAVRNIDDVELTVGGGEAVSIAIEGEASKTLYEAEETFSTSGLKVIATRTDGTTSDVTSAVTWTFEPETLTVETTTVKVTAEYGGFKASKDVAVTVVAAAPSVTLDLTTTAQIKGEPTADLLEYDANVLIVSSARKDENTTAANNYYGGKGTYTSTRFYKDNSLTFTPAANFEIVSITYNATSENYATALASSTWTNAIATVEDYTVTVASTTCYPVTIVPTDGTKPFVATIGANTGAKSMVIKYRVKTVTGLDAVLDAAHAGNVGGKYRINCALRVNYKDDNYVYASTIGGGSTKTAPTEAQKEEWWSDKAADFNQNDWVAIQGLVDVQVGAEIEAGSVATLVSNSEFPVIKFDSMKTADGTAIAANTYRVANFVDSDNELVKKLWLVDPQPAEHCFVKGYVANLGDVVEIDGVFVAEIKSGEKDVVTMYVNYNPADFSITATGWYRFEGVVVNGTSGLELNAVKINEGTATGVEGVETSSVKVYGAEGVINVESEEVAPIAVYSANGAIVSSVEASSASIAVAPGFYIVKAGNSVSKVTVK